MAGLRKIESVILSVANPEFDYMRAMERNIEFCQICGVGAPLFEVETTYAEGGPESGDRYLCKECVLAILEDMQHYALELWKNYEAQIDPDDPFSVDVE